MLTLLNNDFIFEIIKLIPVENYCTNSASDVAMASVNRATR